MKSIKTVITAIVLMIGLTSCGQKSNPEKVLIKQSFIEHKPTLHHDIALEV